MSGQSGVVEEAENAPPSAQVRASINIKYSRLHYSVVAAKPGYCNFPQRMAVPVYAVTSIQ